MLIVAVTNGDDMSFTSAPVWIADTLDHRPAETVTIATLTAAAPKIAAYAEAFPLAVGGDIESRSFEPTLTEAATLTLSSLCE